MRNPLRSQIKVKKINSTLIDERQPTDGNEEESKDGDILANYTFDLSLGDGEGGEDEEYEDDFYYGGGGSSTSIPSTCLRRHTKNSSQYEH